MTMNSEVFSLFCSFKGSYINIWKSLNHFILSHQIQSRKSWWGYVMLRFKSLYFSYLLQNWLLIKCHHVTNLMDRCSSWPPPSPALPEGKSPAPPDAFCHCSTSWILKQPVPRPWQHQEPAMWPSLTLLLHDEDENLCGNHLGCYRLILFWRKPFLDQSMSTL